MKINYFNFLLILVLAFFNAYSILAKNTNSAPTSMDKKAIKSDLFTYINDPLAPVITSFTPSSGSIGTLVTITGTDLSEPIVLTIGGVSAIPISNDGTTLVAMVMLGASSGAISITTIAGTDTSSSNFTATTSLAPTTQQGTKLVGSESLANDDQGWSVSLSADGNTAIVGGFGNNNNQGAAWVYTRSGSIWSQQGVKLVGSENIGAAFQGISVSISADGNTAIVGGYQDDNGKGAVWVFTRNAGVWSQQGTKLVGTGNIQSANQGFSLSLSADGNTAIVGGPEDNSGLGAAWVFSRNLGVWSQQGPKLVGIEPLGTSLQGYSVSLSADGNTAIVGGFGFGVSQGAAWVYTRSSGDWSQQGTKLVGTGNIGAASQGVSVSLSADGNTAMVGGYTDNNGQGAVWVYTRSAGIWSQQGTKLVGTGNIGAANQGISVSLSADGNIAMVGGDSDNNNQGAVWVYTRNADIWGQQASKLVGTGNIGVANQGVSVSLSADGTTALVGGNSDNNSKGAVWVYSGATPLGIEKDIIKGFSMYPNPVTNILNINAQETLKSIQVFNLLGQQVAQKSINDLKTSIDLSRLSRGTYFVKITTDKSTKYIKLIKD